jgi:hypothetical protein
MRISLTVTTTTGRRRIEGVVHALSDLTPILRRFGAYLRRKARARFEAEGPGNPARPTDSKPSNLHQIRGLCRFRASSHYKPWRTVVSGGGGRASGGCGRPKRLLTIHCPSPLRRSNCSS